MISALNLRRVVERRVERDGEDGRDIDDLRRDETRRQFLSSVRLAV